MGSSELRTVMDEEVSAPMNSPAARKKRVYRPETRARQAVQKNNTRAHVSGLVKMIGSQLDPEKKVKSVGAALEFLLQEVGVEYHLESYTITQKPVNLCQPQLGGMEKTQLHDQEPQPSSSASASVQTAATQPTPPSPQPTGKRKRQEEHARGNK